MTATAKVLNGEVKAGDQIAYSTRSGSYQDMTIGEVVEVRKLAGQLSVRPLTWSGYRVPYNGNDGTGRIVTLTALDRVVKLGTVEGAALSEHADWVKQYRKDFDTFVDVAEVQGGRDMKVAALGAMAALDHCLIKLGVQPDNGSAVAVDVARG